jgi:hypothetical protein
VAAEAIEAGKAYLAAGTARLILDTAGGPFPGGTGRQIARRIAAAVAREIPIILAGGLDAGNVARPCWRFRPSASTWLRAWRSTSAGLAERASATARRARRSVPGRARTRSESRSSPSGPGPPASTGRTSSRPTPVPEALLDPDAAGRWGLDRDFGGRYVPETLIAALDQLEAAWAQTRHDPRFWAELRELQFHYGGRPTPIYRADRLGAEMLEGPGGKLARALGGWLARARADRLPDRIRLYLKREDLNHTGAHKLNNALGQVLLTRRLGKSRVIAETGAGMHGVATATACALLEIPCVVHMGVEDIKRQAPNVLRMEALGRRGPAGLRRLGHAQGRRQRGAARLGHQRRDLALLPRLDDGPAPVPDDRARLPARHRRRGGGAALEVEGRLPDMAIACVGGGSNALGLLHRFIGEPSVRLAVAEAAGEGIATGPPRGGAPRRHAGDPPRLALVHAPGRRRPGHRGGLDLGRARLPGHRAAARGADAGGPAHRFVRHRHGGRRRDAAGRPDRRASSRPWNRPTPWRRCRTCWRLAERRGSDGDGAGRGVARGGRRPPPGRPCRARRSSSSASRAAATRTWRLWAPKVGLKEVGR